MAKVIELDDDQFDLLQSEIKNGSEEIYFSFAEDLIPVKLNVRSKSNNESNIVVQWMSQIKEIAQSGRTVSSGGSAAEKRFDAISAYCDAVITSLTAGK